MKYEELFFLELHILKNIKGLTKKLPGHVFSRVGEYFNTFYSHQTNTMDFNRVILTLRYNFNTARSKYKGTGAGKDARDRIGSVAK